MGRGAFMTPIIIYSSYTGIMYKHSPALLTFPFDIYLLISSIEGFQPNYCSDILGNTGFSSKHDTAFVFCV